MKRSRTPSRLSDSLQHRLNMYALAASAAGVGALALAQPADAKIVYTKTHQVIGFRQPYKLDLNHDKITDFTFLSSTSCFMEECAWFLLLSGPRGNGPVGYNSAQGWPFASALKKGSRIGRGDRFVGIAFSKGTYGAFMEQSSLSLHGQWYDVTNRYLGLKFKIKGKTHYGWARLTTTGSPGYTFKATLTGYAYETIPNKAIIAGKTKGPDVITVQPGSLGRLALGRK